MRGSTLALWLLAGSVIVGSATADAMAPLLMVAAALMLLAVGDEL